MTTTAPQMRAVLQQGFGGTDVLSVTRVDRPRPIWAEVLVRVHAASVNPVDWKTREGGGMAGVLGEPPFIPGWDVAGVVEELGYGVTTLAVGDRVFGMPWFPRAAGAYAEYVTAPARQLARIPDNVTDEQAAAVPLAGLTAWQAVVDTLSLTRGDRVLITAAAGGVGHFAVQFARHLGAEVIASASPANHAWLRELGAAETVDYHDPDYLASVGEVDAVIDNGGDGDLALLGLVRAGGTFVKVPTPPSAGLIAKGAERGVRVTPLGVEPDRAALKQIAALLGSGEVRVEVASVLPLERVAEAHALSETHHTRGKIVLAVKE